jgi:hypothetical protein
VPVVEVLFVDLVRPLLARLVTMRGPAPALVAMIGCAGLPMTSVPVRRDARPSGRSAYNFGGRLRSAGRALWWTVAWKWGLSGRAPTVPAVKARFGTRYSSPEVANTHDATAHPLHAAQ